MQSNHGFEGQVNACWTHKMKPREIESIRCSGFPVSVIHGRYIIARTGLKMHVKSSSLEKDYDFANWVQCNFVE